METTTLLTELRDTFLRQQSRIKSPILQKIVEYYAPVVNEPLIVDLFYVKLEEHIAWVRYVKATHLGLLTHRHLYVPASESMLLEFYKLYNKRLQPPHICSGLEVLRLDHGGLPLASLKDCHKAYCWAKSAWLDSLI